MIERNSWTEEDGCLSCPVRRHGLCSKLPERVLARVAGLARQADYAADHDLWEEPDRPKFIGILRQGELRLPDR